MDYINNVIATFLDLECVSCIAVYEGSEISSIVFYQKYLNLCSKDEQKSYRFGKTWGWVINDIILNLGELSL